MKNVEIRRIWQQNLETEFSLIQSMIRYHPFLSIDTEFPGTVFQYSDSYTPLTLASKYELMKASVDNTNIIQLGLRLSDNNGNLPCFGTNSCYIREFNFRDFDVERDLQNTSSIRLLNVDMACKSLLIAFINVDMACKSPICDGLIN
ncbi:probable CCR4-associated factor 1 homolog 9 [Pyrus x bretschneideri]|uniref:probable CCR4-associated factor 1 homolog 9 n=1 Tax=Pyrus x bretschneideri TaxID=225117 RepID=UPI00202EA2F9|nr:probable CCR4-associated factor 1 homolog 9 [Pyrus x bretschneideri]